MPGEEWWTTHGEPWHQMLRQVFKQQLERFISGNHNPMLNISEEKEFLISLYNEGYDQGHQDIF